MSHHIITAVSCRRRRKKGYRPSLPSNKVPDILPFDAVGAGVAVLVVDAAAAVGPERVVEAVVGARAGLGARGELAQLGHVEARGHGEGGAGGGEEESLEGEHGFGCW